MFIFFFIYLFFFCWTRGDASSNMVTQMPPIKISAVSEIKESKLDNIKSWCTVGMVHINFTYDIQSLCVNHPQNASSRTVEGAVTNLRNSNNSILLKFLLSSLILSMNINKTEITDKTF